MKFLHFIIFSFLLLIIGCHIKPVDPIGNLPVIPREKDCPLELYLSLGGVPSLTNAFIEKNRIKELYFVNGGYIDANDDRKFDKEIFIKNLNKVAPNPNASGTGVLNWEGSALKTLDKSKASDPSFKAVEKEYLEVIKTAQKLRPNIKWGIYGLPFRDYWNRNEKWKANNDKLKNILKAADVIFPSVYDFYENGNKSVAKVKDSLYVDENVKSALRYGKQFNKPVIPFYWHRYHNSNKRVGMQTIPWIEFKEQIIAGISAKYQGKHIDGIVWWSSDKYFYAKNSIVKKEVDSTSTIDDYQHKLTVNYSTNIIELFNEYCRKIKI